MSNRPRRVEIGFTSTSDFLSVILTPVGVETAFCGAAFSICPGSRGKHTAFRIGRPALTARTKFSFWDCTATFQCFGAVLGSKALVCVKRLAFSELFGAEDETGSERRS